MNTSRRETKGLQRNKLLKTFLTLFILANTWTALNQTLNTQNKDSTSISYYHLGEFAKFVEYKKQVDSTLIPKYKSEIRSLELVSKTQSKRLQDLLLNKIPALELTVVKSEEQIKKLNEINGIKEDLYKAEKGKKWQWGIYGITLGVVLSLLFGG